MEEWKNIRKQRMTEYSKMLSAMLCHTKVSQKWNWNEIRK